MPSFMIKLKRHGKAFIRGELVLPSAGVYLLKGPVGSGKTSILRELYFHQNKKHTFSYQTLDFPFAPGIKVIDHINMVKNATSIDGDKLEKILMKFNIYNLLENEIERLSDGEKERLMISLALAERTPIALLDEPSARLDRLSISRLLEILEEERMSRIILLSTHSEIFDNLATDLIRIKSNELVSDAQAKSEESDMQSVHGTIPKRDYPRSKKLQLMMVLSTSIFSAITIASLLPLTEYISPITNNFYYGPRESIPTRYVKKDVICSFCNEESLRVLDLYGIPSELKYFLHDDPFVFSISDQYRKVKKGSSDSMSIFVETIGVEEFSVSQGFIDILKDRHGNFTLPYLRIGGLYPESIFADEGVYFRFPEKYIQNLYLESSSNWRYVTNDDIFYNDSLDTVELKNFEVAVNDDLISDKIGESYVKDNVSYRIGGYFSSSKDIEFIMNKDYDFRSDQYELYLSEDVGRYSRSKVSSSVIDRFYNPVDEYSYLKSSYREAILNNTLLYSFALGLPAIMISILLLVLFLSLENRKIGWQRDLYFFYNSPRSVMMKPLRLIDLVPLLAMISSVIIAMPILIFVKMPRINIALIAAFIAVVLLIQLITKCLSSAALNKIRRLRLR